MPFFGPLPVFVGTVLAAKNRQNRRHQAEGLNFAEVESFEAHRSLDRNGQCPQDPIGESQRNSLDLDLALCRAATHPAGKALVPFPPSQAG